MKSASTPQPTSEDIQLLSPVFVFATPGGQHAIFPRIFHSSVWAFLLLAILLVSPHATGCILNILSFIFMKAMIHKRVEIWAKESFAHMFVILTSQAGDSSIPREIVTKKAFGMKRQVGGLHSACHRMSRTLANFIMIYLYASRTKLRELLQV